VFDPSTASGLVRVAEGSRNEAASRIPLVIALDADYVAGFDRHSGRVIKRMPDLHDDILFGPDREALAPTTDVFISK